MQSTLQFNPYMYPIMPGVAFGYFFGFGKSINYNYSNMSTGSQFPLLPLAAAAVGGGYPSVAAPEKLV